MKTKRIDSLVLGIMCFVLTVGICVQIKTVNNYNSVAGTSYKENNLRAEVLKYKEKYDNLLRETENIDNQLQEEIKKATENNSDLEDSTKQIEDGNKIIGLSEVKGPGVVITIADSKVDPNSVLVDLLVHDMDILKIINELKNAGAEAISINGQRIILTTAIYCGGNIININGEKIGSPFEIKAIGSPDTLENLYRPGGILYNLKAERWLDISLEKNNNITIPKYSGVLNFKYVKSVN